MLALFSAFVATSYIFSVTLFGFFTVCAFNKPYVANVIVPKLRKHYHLIEIFASGVTENAIHLVFLKLVIVKLVKLFGGFNYSLAWLFYFADIVNMGALVILFYEMLNEKPVTDTALKSIDPESQPIKSIIGLEGMKKLLHPFWTPSDINVHQNITYATNEEIRDALKSTNDDFDQPRKMMLDIYCSNNMPKTGLQPVMVHIHGGAWRVGSKNIFYPHQKLLVQENNWVMVNIGYRLAPKNPYPTHLIDVKRSLRWIKKNIASFGGDPNFIVLSGDSAGAHLAAMTSLTTNDPKYQPGFEQVDTSVRGVISFSGALDIATGSHHANFFCKDIANLGKVDYEFLHQHSPVSVVPKAKEENKLVPFLVFAGERDQLTESRMSKSFKAAYDKAVGDASPLCQLVLLPGGHHVSYIAWSPRSLYVSYVIQAWCNQLYIKNK
ncbi:Alpha/Beta hydrolase protein [Thamnidium elegans]|nr:Alpha/Beta hydrolase protein [Thamnidium elegans]